MKSQQAKSSKRGKILLSTDGQKVRIEYQGELHVVTNLLYRLIKKMPHGFEVAQMAIEMYRREQPGNINNQ